MIIHFTRTDLLDKPRVSLTVLNELFTGCPTANGCIDDLSILKHFWWKIEQEFGLFVSYVSTDPRKSSVVSIVFKTHLEFFGTMQAVWKMRPKFKKRPEWNKNAGETLNRGRFCLYLNGIVFKNNCVLIRYWYNTKPNLNSSHLAHWGKFFSDKV